MKSLKRSWKTTLGGLMMSLGPTLKPILPAAWDWIGDALLGIGGLIVGATARDNTVNSRQAGAE